MIVLETESCLVSSFIYIFVYICCPLALGKRTKKEASEVLCMDCSVIWFRDLDTTTEWAKTSGSISDADMEKDGVCKMDSCARKSGWRKNNAGTDKEEENKLAGPLAKKELPAEGCSRRNSKREESSGQKKISDDRQHYDKWTLWRYEKEGWEGGRVENAELAVKDLPLGRTLWLIECK